MEFNVSPPTLEVSIGTGQQGPAGPAGPNEVGPDTTLDYADMVAASGDWNLVVANAAGSAFNKFALSSTIRTFLDADDGAGLRSMLGTGTADSTSYLRGDGTWQLLSGIQTTNASLLTSGTLADARLSANVPLKDAANTFTQTQTITSIRSGASQAASIQLKSGFSEADGDVGVGFRAAGRSTDQWLFSRRGSDGRAFASQSSDAFIAWCDGSAAYSFGFVTAVEQPTAGQIRASRLGTNGSAASLSFAGPTSAGTLQDVALLSGGFATATDATFQGQLSIGVRGVVGGTPQTQTGLTVTAQSGGTPRTEINGDAVVSNGAVVCSYFKGPGDRWQLSDSGLSLGSARTVSWSESPYFYGTVDTALGRNAAGVVEVNNGTAGQFRDLVARTLIARQVGGTADTDEVQISHDGSNGKIDAKSGTLTLVASESPFGPLWQIGGGSLGTAHSSLSGFPSFRFATLGYYGGGEPLPGFSTTSTGAFSWSSSSTDSDAARDTGFTRVTAGQIRASSLGTNGSAAGLSFAGPSSTGTLRDVGLVQGGFATSTDATRQGTLSFGAYGIVSGTETLQTGLTVTARSDGAAFTTINAKAGFRFNSVDMGPFDVTPSWDGSGVWTLGPEATSYRVRFSATTIKTAETTVASLPAASTAGAGARAFVTDANATTFLSVVAGGGSNAVPVHSDGTDWRIG